MQIPSPEILKQGGNGPEDERAAMMVVSQYQLPSNSGDLWGQGSLKITLEVTCDLKFELGGLNIL